MESILNLFTLLLHLLPGLVLIRRRDWSGAVFLHGAGDSVGPGGTGSPVGPGKKPAFRLVPPVYFALGSGRGVGRTSRGVPAAEKRQPASGAVPCTGGSHTAWGCCAVHQQQLHAPRIILIRESGGSNLRSAAVCQQCHTDSGRGVHACRACAAPVPRDALGRHHGRCGPGPVKPAQHIICAGIRGFQCFDPDDIGLCAGSPGPDPACARTGRWRRAPAARRESLTHRAAALCGRAVCRGRVPAARRRDPVPGQQPGAGARRADAGRCGPAARRGDLPAGTVRLHAGSYAGKSGLYRWPGCAAGGSAGQHGRL